MGPMNTMLKIDGTFFQFPEGWKTTVFDEWPQYLKPASSLGLKGCDILAINGGTLWIIEVKDYTYPDAKQPEDLATVVGQKAIGTMALLYALQRSKNDSAAVRFARACAVTTEIKLALHIEIKDGGRKERQVRPLLMSLEQNYKISGKCSTSKRTLLLPWPLILQRRGSLNVTAQHEGCMSTDRDCFWLKTSLLFRPPGSADTKTGCARP